MNLHYRTGTLTASPVIFNVLTLGFNPNILWVYPQGSQAGILVEYSLDNQATWKNWPNGGVIAYTQWILPHNVTALRITKYSGPNGTSTYGILG